jgi:hypothetical protein
MKQNNIFNTRQIVENKKTIKLGDEIRQKTAICKLCNKNDLFYCSVHRKQVNQLHKQAYRELDQLIQKTITKTQPQKQEQSKLSKVYEIMDQCLRNSNFFISDAKDKIAKHITVKITTDNITANKNNSVMFFNIRSMGFNLKSTKTKNGLTSLVYSINKKDVN